MRVSWELQFYVLLPRLYTVIVTLKVVLHDENFAKSKMASSVLCRLCSKVLARPANYVRSWSTVPALQAGQKIRIRRGQARDGIAYGPLTDLPDWSFADGTPAPETRRRRIRRYKKIDVAHQILTYLDEMDRAERARDEEGNVIDSTMLPNKHQESNSITTTTKQHQEPTSVE